MTDTDNAVEIVEVPDSILDVLIDLFGEAILDLVENDNPRTLH